VKVRRFIRNRRRLIEVLNEQKQAIINRAVTRGLAPNAPLKPSGIDWLGDVPGHWRIGRVKTEMDNLNTRRIPLNATERGKMTLRKYDYYGASGVIDKVDEYLFDDELLLIAEDGANLVLRNLPLAIIARGKFWVNNHAHILKPKRGSLEYFAALLECIDYLPWISGAAQPKLTQDRLMAVRLPVPPENEQREIADWIVANTGDLSAAIDKAKREIDLIREYRERMVSDVVTGKLEVCGLAPTEPLSAAEPIDDEEMLGDDESELVEEAADELD
jgi:type I restriction enzyme S subunit